MNSLCSAIVSIGILVNVVALVLVIIGFVKKDFKIRPKKAALVWVISFVVIIIGNIGVNATMTPEQKAEKEAQTKQEAEEQTEKDEPVAEEPKTEATEGAEEQKEVIEYDELQKIFIALSFDTKPSDLEEMIQEYGLCSASQDFNSDNGTVNYIIAFTDGTAKFKYADPGDYLEVSFEKKGDNEFRYAHYVNESSLGTSALLYHHGTWYEFADGQNAEDYSGYYSVVSLGGKDDGLVIKYTNGNESKTNYHLCESAEAALNINAQ